MSHGRLSTRPPGFLRLGGGHGFLIGFYCNFVGNMVNIWNYYIVYGIFMMPILFFIRIYNNLNAF